MFAQVSALLAIYFVLWWIVLFATLPFGVRNSVEAGEEAGEAVPGAKAIVCAETGKRFEKGKETK